MKYDIHCHLTSTEYSNPDKIINECETQKISVILNGLDYLDNEKVLSLSKSFKNVYVAMGMHPTNVFDIKVISQIIENKGNIVAIGEIGLDFKQGVDEKQVINLRKLIRLAEKLNKPVIVHSRMAEERLLKELKNIKIPVILHCFTGKKALLKEALKNPNTYFSIPASVHYSEQFQELVKALPISKLLCETDSPYLWKEGLNTPLNIAKAYEAIAKIKGISLIDCERLIQKNFEAIFKNH